MSKRIDDLEMTVNKLVEELTKNQFNKSKFIKIKK